MSRSGALLAVAWIAFGVSLARAAQIVEGEAVRLADGTPAYLETHRLDGRDHRIDYHDPQGRLIGELVLDYGCSDTAPDFSQRDLRADRQQAGHWDGRSYRVASGDDAPGTLRSKTLAVPADGEPLVASSGFDRFLRAEWDRLLGGESLVLRFAMPARLSAIALRARHDPTPGDGLTWFVLEPEQPLLRLLAEPIRVGYDADRELVVYRGLSNLADADGSALEVEIRYRRTAAAEPELARTEPLDDRWRTTVSSQCNPEPS